MVDTRGRIRTCQANVVSARSRLHSPLFRNTRCSTSATSSTVDETDDDPLVRETPLYRHKQVFFGADFDAKAAPPQRSPASTRSSLLDDKPHSLARSHTGSSLRLTLDDDALAECRSDTTLSGLDTTWETPPLTAENIGKVLRDHSYPRALAVSSEISDSLSRMKMRKHEMEMAAVVQKVQAQLKTMEDVIKELQNEHTIKNEMLKKQIAESQRVAAERDQLKHALSTVSVSNNPRHDTNDDVSMLQSSLQAFMNQTEHTQYLLVEQLKTMAAPKGSPRRGSIDAHKIEASVKAAMSDVAQLQRTMLTTLETSRQSPAPATASTPTKARALPPPPPTSSGLWKAAVMAMAAIWLATLGVGTGYVTVNLDAVARFVSLGHGEALQPVVSVSSTLHESVPTTANAIDAPLSFASKDDTAVITVLVDVDGDVAPQGDAVDVSTSSTVADPVEAATDVSSRVTALDDKDGVDNAVERVTFVANEIADDAMTVDVVMAVTPEHVETELLVKAQDHDASTDQSNDGVSIIDEDGVDAPEVAVAPLSDAIDGTIEVEQASLVVEADEGHLEGAAVALVDTVDELNAVVTTQYESNAIAAEDAQDEVAAAVDMWSDAIAVVDEARDAGASSSNDSSVNARALVVVVKDADDHLADDMGEAVDVVDDGIETPSDVTDTDMTVATTAFHDATDNEADVETLLSRVAPTPSPQDSIAESSPSAALSSTALQSLLSLH
ncbi:hypothetical protein SDRG_14544 [Saprolegnia diclina VS20]|uniref:Uncharacterized protein n=1 Tax=Saprolegnia diclina (strain VS20) TaxID=1156394 RepID=T0R6C1_SAPDV|nr:hypothetical protein SDRG_14544 [Saprolegnia diclina VS20]EQC27633.1 hypothetical protein SDRG_14544 [Saprolegnia diclina VS20]|eukprot:XP_008618901.1 hypothetical protein SDRG_14544 [Saprolegnia diclina VS20]